MIPVLASIVEPVLMTLERTNVFVLKGSLEFIVRLRLTSVCQTLVNTTAPVLILLTIFCVTANQVSLEQIVLLLAMAVVHRSHV